MNDLAGIAIPSPAGPGRAPRVQGAGARPRATRKYTTPTRARAVSARLRKKYGLICDSIAAISPVIRFVGMIGESGELLAYNRRSNLKPLLDEKDTHYQFSHIAMRTDLETYFDKSLGPIQFVWEERTRAQIISFAIKRHRVWISIDKKVVRSEVLRIVDACLPVVKRYS